MTQVQAPCSGRVVPLSEVPDEVFSAAMLGPGVAVDPDPELTVVRAPLGGSIVKIHPHAFVVQAEAGAGVLVHLGIDTVKLNGRGFTVLASDGDTVQAGDPLIEWDPGEIAEKGISTVVPVVALDVAEDAVGDEASGTIRTGDPLFTLS